MLTATKVTHFHNFEYIPWVVEEAGEGVCKEGLYLEGIAVLEAGRSLSVVHHQANGIREYT